MKLFYLILNLLPLVCLSQTNDLLPSQLLVYHDVGFHQKYFKAGNLSGIDVTKIIITQTINGTVKAYHPDNIVSVFYPYDIFNTEIISPQQIAERMGETHNITLEHNRQTGKWDTIVSFVHIDTTEAGSLIFVESWNFNSRKFQFTKDIEALIPVRHFKKDGSSQQLKKRILLINQTQKPNYWQLLTLHRRMQSLGNFQYLQPLDARSNYNYIDLKDAYNELIAYQTEIEMYDAPYFNSISRKKLIYTIFDMVEQGKITPHDFFTDQILTLDQVAQRMTSDIQTYQATDNSGITNTYENTIIDIDQIRSVIFTEEWLLDYKTLYFEKKVKAIAMVRHYLQNGEEIKEVIFNVRFNH